MGAGTFTTTTHDTESECEALGMGTPYRWVTHPVGSGLVAQDTNRNLQCCSCLPALRSGVTAATLATYTDETACNGVERGRVLGWVRIVKHENTDSKEYALTAMDLVGF